MGEQWREMPGFPGYFVSSLGRVRGKKGAVMKPSITRRGYQKVGAFTEGGRKHNLEIHRMVALSFLGAPPEGKPVAAHGDGNPLNNRLDNLRWASHVENAADREAHGRTAHTRGEACGTSVVTEEQVREIRTEHARKVLTQAMLGEIYGLTHQAIWAIVNRKTWGHVA